MCRPELGSGTLERTGLFLPGEGARVSTSVVTLVPGISWLVARALAGAASQAGDKPSPTQRSLGGGLDGDRSSPAEPGSRKAAAGKGACSNKTPGCIAHDVPARIPTHLHTLTPAPLAAAMNPFGSIATRPTGRGRGGGVWCGDGGGRRYAMPEVLTLSVSILGSSGLASHGSPPCLLKHLPDLRNRAWRRRA